MGGGTLPLHQFEGAGVVIVPCKTSAAFDILTTEGLEHAFRSLKRPVIGRIQDGRFELHMQTVFDEELSLFIEEGLTVLAGN